MIGDSIRDLIQALNTVRGNDIIGKSLKGRDNGVTVGTLGDSLGAPVLSEHIIKDNREASVQVSKESITGGTIRGETKSPVGNTRRIDAIIQVKWVGSVLASTKRTVRTVVTSITLATKSDILIPELVDVAIVVLGNLLDGVTHTVTRTVSWARGSLAGRPLIALKALTSSRLAITDTLVGAFHVVMGSVGKLVASRVHHVGELFSGSVRVHLTVYDYCGAGAR
jgi:hypothetical protein